jgi:putative glutamine amidotransferase
VLAICGGHQLVNISRGGALVQDLKTEWRPLGAQCATLPHADNERKGTSGEGNAFRHEVTLTPGCAVAEIIGRTSILANSYHHQAIMPSRLGKGLVATGWSDDGVIEAIELTGDKRFVLGVQWHPERLTYELEHHLLFDALVGAAGG